MVLGAVNSDAYKIVLILHILAVIVGIGAVFLNGVYGAQAKAVKGPEGLAIAEANFRVTKIAEYVIYAIPVLGIALVFMSKTDGVKVYDFGQTWVWLAIVLYVVAIGIVHGLMFPSVKRLIALMHEMIAMGPPPAVAAGAPAPGGPPSGAGAAPPQVAEMEALGNRLAIGGLSLNVLTVVLVYLMVWKPGF